jgi:preprotein translocase subunit SecB
MLTAAVHFAGRPREGIAMAETENGDATLESGVTDAPQVGVLAQYVKDLSFENPNAPQSLQAQQQAQPQIEVNVNVNARKLGDDVYEVDLKIEVAAKQGATVTFMIDLLYGGLFGVRNLPEENLEAFLVVSAPTLLFPYARRVISDATRDGGFPPLLLEPVDFGTLYLQQRQTAGGNGPSIVDGGLLN